MSELYATNLPAGALVSSFELELVARVACFSSTSTSVEAVPTTMPAAIPADQAYYWSIPWQHDIRASLDALTAGEFVDFDDPNDPNDVARWLLADDNE